MFLLQLVFSVYFLFWPFALFHVKHEAERQNLQRQPPLPDLFHAILPPISLKWTQLTDLASYLSSWSILLWSIFGRTPWCQDYILYMTCLQGLRCLCFNLTILPHPRTLDEEKPIWRSLLFGGTYDLIYSGHIMYLYAPWWFLFSQDVISAHFLLGMRAVTGFAATIILSARAHYTIDVFVAVAASHFVYDILFS